MRAILLSIASIAVCLSANAAQGDFVCSDTVLNGYYAFYATPKMLQDYLNSTCDPSKQVIINADVNEKHTVICCLQK